MPRPISGGASPHLRAHPTVHALRPTSHARHCCAQNADHFAHNSPFSAFFTEVVCTLGAAPPRTAATPSQNGGGGIARHEAPTRRRHAARGLHVVQNPHRSQPRAPRCIQDRQGRLARKNSPDTAPPAAPPRKTRPARTNMATMKPTTPLLAPQQGTAETGITSAPKNCTKNAYFSPAKATAVSILHRHKRAQAITVSNHRTTWPTRPGCGARGRRRGLVGRPVGGQCYKRRHTNAIHIATRGLLLQTSSI